MTRERPSIRFDVADGQSNEFPKPQPGIVQHEKNRPVADGAITSSARIGSMRMLDRERRLGYE
jgi:hypothetical protein